jgi:hypothetical protein
VIAATQEASFTRKEPKKSTTSWNGDGGKFLVEQLLEVAE